MDYISSQWAELTSNGVKHFPFLMCLSKYSKIKYDGSDVAANDPFIREPQATVNSGSNLTIFVCYDQG